MEDQMEQGNKEMGDGSKGGMTLVDGVFDPLHNGHIAYFKAAYDLGLPVVCNISESTKRRPLLKERERASIIGSTRWVSDITFRGTEVALSELDLAYYVKGADWTGKLPQSQIDICRDRNIAIVYTMTTRNSSSEIMRDWMGGTVDDFEAKIHAQKEPEPWTNTYSLEVRREIEGRHPQLIKEVFNPSYVIDAGCGPGMLLALLHEIGIKGTGFDKQDYGQRWIDDIATTEDRVVADLVICREVLEHMPVLKVQKAVENLCRLTTKYVYVTTRFSNCGLFYVGNETHIDPTHITCLNKDMLRLMFVLQGMRRRADLEEKMDWMNKGRVLVYEKA